MIYKKFNKYIKEHFFKPENIGETVVLSVDESIVSDFCKESDITKGMLRAEIIRLFSKDWSFALGKEANLHGQQEFSFVTTSEDVVSNSDIPLFFGFITIQVYVASLMQDNDNFSGRQYNPRLCEYLGYSQDSQALENKYYGKYQDKIWNNIRNWACQEGFEFEIPSKRKNTGRYVQYPLFHCLLNAEDLKHLPNLFEKVRLKPFESICFEDFKDLVTCHVRVEGLTNHFYKVKERLELAGTVEYLYHQVYNFYVNWRGDNSCPVITEENINTTLYDTNTEKQNVILYADKELTKLTVNYSDDEPLFVFSINEPNIFSELEEYYKKFHKTRLFLIRNESNGDEWEDERFLDERKDFIVILDRHKSNESLKKNLSKEFNEVYNKHYWIYKISSEHGKVKALQHFYTKSKKNYNIQNGLKLSRKVWMFGAGPEIVFDGCVTAGFDGKKIEFEDGKYLYDCKDLEVGRHVLNVKNFTPSEIIIEEAKIATIERSIGWYVSKDDLNWGIDSDNYNVVGLHYDFPCLVKDAKVPEWILAVKGHKVDVNKSVVINAIRRSKHGI